MFEPRETEDYVKGLMIRPLLASICKDRLLRLKPNYIGISTDADSDTESNVASISDLWKCHLAKTKGKTPEPIEWVRVRGASSVVSIHVEKTCSFVTLENNKSGKDYPGYYSLIGSTQLTAYDGWRDGKSAEFYQIVTPVAPEKNDLFVLHNLYEFNFSGEEERFIQKNSHLIPFLKEVKGFIKKICSRDFKAALQFVKDEEEDEALFIIIKSTYSTDENLSLLRKLDDEWWLDVPYSIRKVVSLDVISE